MLYEVQEINNKNGTSSRITINANQIQAIKEHSEVLIGGVWHTIPCTKDGQLLRDNAEFWTFLDNCTVFIDNPKED